MAGRESVNKDTWFLRGYLCQLFHFSQYVIHIYVCIYVCVYVHSYIYIYTFAKFTASGWTTVARSVAEALFVMKFEWPLFERRDFQKVDIPSFTSARP